MRIKELLENNSAPIRLGHLCDVKTNFSDADFWIQRKGSKPTVGSVLEEFSPENIGIKVKKTDELDPKYLYYFMMRIHGTGHWAANSKGTLNLRHISTGDVANLVISR